MFSLSQAVAWRTARKASWSACGPKTVGCRAAWALSTGVMVVDGSFEALDLGPLWDHWDVLVIEAVKLLGPGVFVVPRAEAFRVAAPKAAFAAGGR